MYSGQELHSKTAQHDRLKAKTHTHRPFDSWSRLAVDDDLELGIVAEWNGRRVGFLEELRVSLGCHVTSTTRRHTVENRYRYAQK